MTAAQRDVQVGGAAKEDWVMLAEACRILGRARAQVLGLIVRGELVANTAGRYTLVSRESLEAYQSRTGAEEAR